MINNYIYNYHNIIYHYHEPQLLPRKPLSVQVAMELIRAFDQELGDGAEAVSASPQAEEAGLGLSGHGSTPGFHSGDRVDL